MGIPGGPVVKTPCFQCRGPRLIPGGRTKIPHAALQGQTKHPSLQAITMIFLVIRIFKINSLSKLWVSITVLAIVNQDMCLGFPELHPAYLKLCILGATPHFPVPHP
jgi:hypothetical protein